VSISRPVYVAISAVVIALGVSACGSDSNSSSTASAGAGANRPGNGRGGFLQDPKVVACLKKQGVSIPSGSRRGSGAPPAGTNGQPPAGQGAPNRRPDSAQFQKLRAALQKCGVEFPGPAPNGQPPQGQGTATTTAS
jgi:hypothetical protein